MNVTLRQLAAALAVARRQNFRRAAEDVHLSQPALSLAVAELERNLGVVLFDRTSRTVQVTAIGQGFLAEAGRLVGDLQALVRDVRDAARAHRGRVVVTCIASVAARIMPRAIQRCAERYPGVEVTIRDDVTTRVGEVVRSGEADLGVTAGTGGSAGELDFELLLEDPFFVVCPRGHRIAAVAEARWADLSGETFVAFSTTSGVHVAIGEQMRRDGVQPRHTVAVSQLAAVHGMLEEGFGVSILPRLALPVDSHPTLVARPLVDPAMARSVGIVRRRDRALSPAASAFADVLREVTRGR